MSVPHPFGQRRLSLAHFMVVVLLPVLVGKSFAIEPNPYTVAQQQMQQGNFAKVITLAESEIEKRTYQQENWLELKLRAELKSGKYAAAKQTIETGLQAMPDSIRLRWLGISAYRFNNDPENAARMESEIQALLEKSMWRYRDIPNQMVYAEYLLSQNVDAKKVLDDVYTKAKDRNPSLPLAWMAIGELGLAKSDYDLAAKNFSKAVSLDPTNPDAHFGLALAYRSSVPERSQEAIDAALSIDEHHVPTLQFVAERQIAGESYAEATKTIERILKVNPESPEAWSLKAVLAHLDNDPKSESTARERALKHWPQNPAIDHIIGKELSKKYRFAEGSECQRRALAFDANYLLAKIQLANDLLRLGKELEGWKLAEEVFDVDQYNVVANNLVALRDQMSEYASAEKNGFVVRMAKEEFDAYGHLVFDLVEEASEQLTAKYDVKLRKPIFIEIFPEQKDFAIRTFGVPGGAGFLGVCFGRVVTMNSPVAQGASQTNWRSVLWHEFCHVVTLQKTNNKMPRWLSEGISVYEERLANPAWGDSIKPAHREMILSDELTPVSQLSSAFLSPKSAQHLHFAYYESSLVVQFLVEKFGEPRMVALLDDLRRGTTINDALGRHMASTEYLDKEFDAYAKKIANNLAPKADWTKPDRPIIDLAGWTEWLGENPNNYYGLRGVASSLVQTKDYELGLAACEQLAEVYGDAKGSENIWRLKAAAHRGLKNADEEIVALEKVIELDASDIDTTSRLLDIYTASGKWGDLKRVATFAQGINPMLKNGHRSLALAAEKTNDDAVMIRELRVLSALNPFDKADTYYRLASAEFRQGALESAKRNTLLALEAAPRYRDAHRLLLKTVAALEENVAPADSDQTTDSTPDATPAVVKLATEQEVIAVDGTGGTQP